jgi:hypothetical protein
VKERKTIGNGDEDSKPIASRGSPETTLDILQAQALRLGSSLDSEAWCEIGDGGKYAQHCCYDSVYVEVDVV